MTLPGGLQADDLIIVTFAVGDSPGADNDLSGAGYTEIADLAETGDTVDTELWVGYRYFVAGDTTAPTSTWTPIGGTNASNASVLMVFRGVATVAQGGPFSATATTATGTNGSNPDPPSITWSDSGTWTVIAGATGHTGGATATYTNPTGYTTNAVVRAHNDTFDALTGMGYNSAPSGTENPGVMTAATIGVDADNSWCAVTMALKEAPVVASLLPAPGTMRNLLRR